MTYFFKPDVFSDSNGHPRRVGFELEFGNVPVRDTATMLHKQYGGMLEEKNPFVFYITDSAIGRIKIERDAHLLTSVKHRDVLEKMSVDFKPGMLASEIEKGVDKLSSLLIPCEVVTGPLEFSQFPKIEEMVRKLAILGVEGTQDSLFNAFGLHLNPSVPDLTADTLIRYMQAFLLLEEWIIETSDIDFTRRYFTNYIDPFPYSYSRLVLTPEYSPGTQRFIADYLNHNPTRNRSLDMLPILCEIDINAVRKRVRKEEHELLSSRPAFHYRLPDCRIGDPEWTVAGEWNRWWYVEQVASDNALLNTLLKKWLEIDKQAFITRKKQWVEAVQSTLERNITLPEKHYD